MATRITFIFTLISVLIYSCQKDEQNCHRYVAAKVVGVEGPVEAAKNEEITLIIAFGCSSGCGRFGYFDIMSEKGKEQTIQVIAEYIGCICTADVPIRTGEYYFKVAEAGVYNLNFIGYDTILTHQIVVN